MGVAVGCAAGSTELEADSEGNERGRPKAADLFAELDRHRIEYVVVRGGHRLDGDGPIELRLLVGREELVAVERVLRDMHLTPEAEGGGGERRWSFDERSNGRTNGRGSAPAIRVDVTTALLYGRPRKCLGSGPHEKLVLRRRQHRSGAALASACDELMDLVLHCVLDLKSFPEAHRERVAELIAAMREDPPLAGRAAERFQQELAPALPWASLLAWVRADRWDEIVARRGRIARHLARRSPVDTLRGLMGSPAAPRLVSEQVDAPVVRDAPQSTAAAVSRKQIRGSGLFLFGRALGAGLKFASELIVVRYLATSQYGAWTYALAAVTFLRGISTLGLNRAIARYLPLHLERGEIDQFYGVLAVVTGLMAIVGAAVIGAFFAFPHFVAGLAGVVDEQPLDLLFILIFLVPIDQLDNGLTGVCAALGISRPIFVRRFLLNPGLRLVIAASLVLMAADVHTLAYGYLLAGVIGVGYYAWSVLQRLRKQGLLRMRWIRAVRLPFRRVLTYTTPVMAADWCAVFMATAGPLLLGYFSDMSTVALYQVVMPVAALNQLVSQAFAMLFEPSASRLVARGDRVGLERHYWRTAMWVSVLSFPLFALSFTAAVPLTVLLFGERYAAAAPILSLVALSQFVQAAAGFNDATLRVSGKLGWLIAANITGVVVLVGVSVALIPSMGALGAGIGTAAGQLCYTVIKQLFARIAVGVESLDHEHRGFYVAMAAVFCVFLVVRIAFPRNLWIITPVVLGGALLVFLTARRSLSVGETFPELGRLPVLGKILG
ncbi:MAG: flippase [Gemmatimonadales bacterium]